MQVSHLSDTKFRVFQVGFATPLCSFYQYEKAPSPSGFGAFSFVANEEARQRQSAVTLPERSQLVELADSEPDTSLCDSVKSTLKAYLFEAETKALGLIFGNVNLLVQTGKTR